MAKILIIGGYGNFGKRLAKNLALNYPYKIAIAGRSIERAKNLSTAIEKQYNKHIDFYSIDVASDTLPEKLQTISPHIVVNASGPYLYNSGNHDCEKNIPQNYILAKTCAHLGIHYIDLADSRDYVFHFKSELHDLALKNNVSLVTGASSVPGLSSAVISNYINHYTSQGYTLNSLKYGIAPGNQTERGLATVASILSYTGQAFLTKYNNQHAQIYGWQDLQLKNFGPPLRRRWMSNCNIPDLGLFPEYYPEIRSIQFQAGLEVSILHLGLWLLSWLPRIGLINNLDQFSQQLTNLSEYFINCGSDAGGMFMELELISETNPTKHIEWQLIAENGVGPNVPTFSAELVINKIINNQLASGAMPCINLFSLDEIEVIAHRHGIYFREKIDDE